MVLHRPVELAALTGQVEKGISIRGNHFAETLEGTLPSSIQKKRAAFAAVSLWTGGPMKRTRIIKIVSGLALALMARPGGAGTQGTFNPRNQRCFRSADI
jgi:hypothetical protein